MNGKDKCELLKNIRRQIAEQYSLEYHPTECHHKGECAGTCPRCDAELENLQRQLEARGIHNINLNEVLCEQVDRCGLSDSQNEDDVRALQGDIPSEPDETRILEGMPSIHPDDLKRVPG